MPAPAVARSFDTRGAGIVLAWIVTLVVLGCEVAAGLGDSYRSLSAVTLTGFSMVIGIPCRVALAFVGPASVLVTWFVDTRPATPRLPRIRRLVGVGLAVGLPAAGLAWVLLVTVPS